MPYKTGALKGKLNSAEIRKLIKAHNVLNTIKIPKGAKRDDLIKLVEGKGYSINHEKQSISRKIKKRTETISLEGAKKLTKPKEISQEEKKKRQQAKQKKAGEKAFLKTVIPKPPPVSKSSKGVKVGKPPPKKSKKEDEIRPARKAAPPIPKAKDFVKIGAKPKGQRVNTDGSRNVGKVVEAPKKPKKPKKTEEEKKANREKIKRYDDLSRLKISELRKYVDMYNERDDKEMTLKSKGQDKDQLVNKIVGYNIDKIFKIPIPAKKVKQTEEQKTVKKKQNQQKANEEAKKRRPFLPYLKYIGELKRKYNAETKRKNYTNVEEVIKKMKEQLEDKYDEIVEKADEKDIELDDDVYEEIENDVGNYYNELKQKAIEANEKTISKKKDREKDIKDKKKNISNNKKDMDFKIGDTYLFKIKNKEFEGIASKINDKSVSMTFRWVNDKTLTKPIKKEDIVKRLGGTDYDEDLMERYNGLR